MNPGTAVGIGIIAFAALVGLIALLVRQARRWEQRRRSELQALASRLGLRYEHDDPLDCTSLPFPLFQMATFRGGSENVLWGTIDGIAVRLFEFWYREEEKDMDGNSSSSTRRYRCAVAEISAECPPLEIQPENAITRFVQHLGFHDIEFESEEFNRRFLVNSRDRRFASAFVDPRMMEWLLQTRARNGFAVSDKYTMCADQGSFKPQDIEELLRKLLHFREHIPPIVADLYPPRSP